MFQKTLVYYDLKRDIDHICNLYGIDPTQYYNLIHEEIDKIENILKFKEIKENISNYKMNVSICTDETILKQTSSILPNLIQKSDLDSIDYNILIDEIKEKLNIESISNSVQQEIEKMITHYLDSEIDKEFESSEDEDENCNRYIRHNRQTDISTNKWWNDVCLDKIKITDNSCAQAYTVAIIDEKMLNRNNQCVGYQEKWIDYNDEIPDIYKSKDNVILHPEYNIELYQYIIEDKEFTNLPKSVYREFIFDLNTNSFRNSNEIEHIV